MRTVLLFFVSVFFAVAQAQQFQDDVDRLVINPYLPPYEDLPDEASKLLHTKLTQIVTANGVADNEYITRFIFTAKINVITKDIVVGPPQRISQKLEITL